MLCFFLLVYFFMSAAYSDPLSRHRRSWIIDSFTIEEEHPGPFPYTLGRINIERAYGIYFQMFGEGVDEEPKGILSIDEESGTLYVHGPVDYEKTTLLQLKFEVRRKDSTIDTNLGIHIAILDINDNPPLFQKDLYEITINEDDASGSGLMNFWASDKDQRGSPNSTFHYEIKSVSPKNPETEFIIDSAGKLSFKGCLDYEVAKKYTVLVEVKDHGDVISLSSSTTVVIHVRDANNHLPTISRQTGSGKVKEGDSGISVLRIHSSDSDSPNSPAWRARYTIHGDKQENFKIETDPDTNDGVLTVVKPLDFEDGAQRELSISVENEIPYFTCKVKERPSQGPWKVDYSKLGDSDAAQPHSVKVVIEIEDVNDPPVFSVPVKEALLEENAPSGSWVEKVTAVDHDSSHARDFVYKVGHDPAGWLKIDPHTGNITTVKTPDRESPHVVDGIYTVLLHAVDNGNPALTGTATLIIHVVDQNDNVPQLMETSMEVCMSDTPTRTNITAFDLDDSPFGGPFNFELLGDIKGKWKLDPSHGYIAGLVTEQGVYAGPHTVDLKVSSMQGEFGVYSLSVTVCDCSVNPNCQMHRKAAASAFGAMGVIFTSLFLLLLIPLMAVVFSCKKVFTALRAENLSGETLLVSNIETPGTDCKVTVPGSLVTEKTRRDTVDRQTLHDGMQNGRVSTQEMQQQLITKSTDQRQNMFSANMNHLAYNNTTSEVAQQSTWSSQRFNSFRHSKRSQDAYRNKIFQRTGSIRASDATVRILLHRRLTTLQQTEDELQDYEPHLYADEGDSDHVSDFEDIIPNDDSFEKVVNDLGPKFSRLGSICRKPQRQKLSSFSVSCS